VGGYNSTVTVWGPTKDHFARLIERETGCLANPQGKQVQRVEQGNSRHQKCYFLRKVKGTTVIKIKTQRLMLPLYMP
jgi:ribosomal protein L19